MLAGAIVVVDGEVSYDLPGSTTLQGRGSALVEGPVVFVEILGKSLLEFYRGYGVELPKRMTSAAQ